MSESIMLHRVRLESRHTATGRTIHRVHGTPMARPAELRMVRFPGDPGCLLLDCDADGREMTDTWHDIASHPAA